MGWGSSAVYEPQVPPLPSSMLGDRRVAASLATDSHRLDRNRRAVDRLGLVVPLALCGTGRRRRGHLTLLLVRLGTAAVPPAGLALVSAGGCAGAAADGGVGGCWPGVGWRPFVARSDAC